MTKKQKALAKKFAQTIAKEHGFSFKQTEMVLLEIGGTGDNTFDYVMFSIVGDDTTDYQVGLNSDGTSTFTEYKNGFPTSIGEEIDKDEMLAISEYVAAEVLSPSQTALVVDSVMVAVPTVADLDTATLYIKNEIAGVANSFCRIGFKLYEVNKNNLFKLANLNNIYEYAEQYLGFKKSSTANYISICKRFSIKDEKGLPTSVLADNFESFSYTQLSEMLTLPAEKIEEISPNMTIKEIRLAKSGADSSEDIAEKTEENAGLYAVSIFDRKLTEKNIDLVIKLLRDNIGKDIQITTF